MINVKYIERRVAELKKMIITSEYHGSGWAETNCEYNTLCWVLGIEREDLQKIKNDYLLNTLA